MAASVKHSQIEKKSISRSHNGFSVIEVLLALGMASIIIISIGTAFAANDRLSTSSLNQAQALNFARQGMEIIQKIKDSAFGCSVVSPATTCTNGSTQACTPINGYSSCWSEFPKKSTGGHWTNGPLKPVVAGSSWELQDGTETLGAFTRSITIANIDTSCPNHCNSKTVTVDVSWTENTGTKHTILTTEITGWKNFP